VLIGTKVDNIVLWGASLKEHNDRLMEVFDRLRLNYSQINASS
jgi:hypothetical protein